MELLGIYLLIINALSFLFMSVDKHRAKKNLWRIPERTLLLLAAIGGSFGSLLGMRLVRHKTRKPAFSIGIPILFAIQVILLFFSLILSNNV